MRVRKLVAGLLFGMGAFIVFVWLFLLSLLVSGGPVAGFTLGDALSAGLPVLLGIDAMAAGVRVKMGKGIRNLMLFGIIIIVALFASLITGLI